MNSQARLPLAGLWAVLALLASCAVCEADTFQQRLEQHQKSSPKYGDVAGGTLQVPYRLSGGDVPLSSSSRISRRGRSCSTPMPA